MRMAPEQCRAARAWLKWSQADLAAKARVSASTIRSFEAGRRVPHTNNVVAMLRAIEAAGLRLPCAPDGSPLGVMVAPPEAAPPKAVKVVKGKRAKGTAKR